MHEIAAFDARPPVRGHLHVVKIESTVVLDSHVFQKRVAFEASVVRFDLFAGVQGVGFEEQSVGLEAEEAAIAGEYAAVVLNEPRAFASFYVHEIVVLDDIPAVRSSLCC